jgi:NADPH:quinone reductase-like Zn-dependent oxidoreductase
MKAFAYRDRIAFDSLVEVNLPDPEPGPHDVVLRMRAAALNYRDLAIASGNYHIAVNAPLIPLSDGAGEVLQIGAQVIRVRIGDIACPTYLPDWIEGPVSPRLARRRLGGPSDGVLAEMICLHEDEIVKAPSHLDPVESATLPVAAVTAWHCLYQLGTLRPGETLVVLGSGGVSTSALQLARAGGARVIAVTRREGHRARLQQLGATDVVLDDGSGESRCRARRRPRRRRRNGCGRRRVAGAIDCRDTPRQRSTSRRLRRRYLGHARYFRRHSPIHRDPGGIGGKPAQL